MSTSLLKFYHGKYSSNKICAAGNYESFLNTFVSVHENAFNARTILANTQTSAFVHIISVIFKIIKISRHYRHYYLKKKIQFYYKKILHIGNTLPKYLYFACA